MRIPIWWWCWQRRRQQRYSSVSVTICHIIEPERPLCGCLHSYRRLIPTNTQQTLKLYFQSAINLATHSTWVDKYWAICVYWLCYWIKVFSIIWRKACLLCQEYALNLRVGVQKHLEALQLNCRCHFKAHWFNFSITLLLFFIKLSLSGTFISNFF